MRTSDYVHIYFIIYSTPAISSRTNIYSCTYWKIYSYTLPHLSDRDRGQETQWLAELFWINHKRQLLLQSTNTLITVNSRTSRTAIADAIGIHLISQHSFVHPTPPLVGHRWWPHELQNEFKSKPVSYKLIASNLAACTAEVHCHVARSSPMVLSLSVCTEKEYMDGEWLRQRERLNAAAA